VIEQRLARLEFRRSGGFAGNLPPVVLDRGSEDLRALEPLVDLDALASARSAGRAPPDGFRYQLHVETAAGDVHELTCGDTDLPASLRPLVQRLTQLAREPERRS
jgi:hypothetical protein